MKNSGEKGTGRSGTYCNKELQYDGGREVAGEDAALRTGVEDVDAATPSSITQVAQSLTDYFSAQTPGQDRTPVPTTVMIPDKSAYKERTKKMRPCTQLEHSQRPPLRPVTRVEHPQLWPNGRLARVVVRLPDAQVVPLEPQQLHPLILGNDLGRGRPRPAEALVIVEN